MKILVIALLSLAHFALGAKEYQVFSTMTDWIDAHEGCSSWGMQIASVESVTEQDALIESIRSSNKFMQDQDTWFWLGANDVLNMGRWSWFSSGMAMGYTNWKNGEPPSGKPPFGGNCAKIESGTWMWNNSSCSDKGYYVCEKDPNQCYIVKRQYESRLVLFSTLRYQFKTAQSQNEISQKKYEAAQNQSETLQKQYETTESQYGILQKKYETVLQQYENVQKMYDALHKQYETVQSQHVGE